MYRIDIRGFDLVFPNKEASNSAEQGVGSYDNTQSLNVDVEVEVRLLQCYCV